MAAEDIKQLVDKISSMSVLDVSELVKALEEKLGVSAAAPMMAVAAPVAGAAGAEEKSSFTVIIKEVGDKKINVIKEIRAVTGLGLAEAKALAEPNAVVKEGVAKDEASKIKEQLESAGAKVELK